MPAKMDEIIKLLVNDPYLVAKAVGFKDFHEWPHNDWLKKILFADNTVTTIQAHRGSYKTTALSVAVALFMVMYPTKTIFLVRKTEGDVATFVSQVKNILGNQVLREMAKALYGIDLRFSKSSMLSLDTNLNSGVKGAYQFDTVSLSGSLTGKHADWVITDDIVTLRDRISRAEREHTKEMYMELQNVVNRGGRITNLGTPWHKEDAFQLMGEIDRYSIYDTGMIDHEQENRLRQSMSPSLFAANYELKHIADEEAMFDAPRFYEGDSADIYDGTSHIDAAYGGSDYTAFTIAKRIDDEKIIVFGKLWPKHVDDCLGEIEAFHKAFRAGTVYTEKNADKGYLLKELMRRGIPAGNYSETMNKFIKISTHLRSNWARVYFLRETDPEYIQQILDYTENAEHDDAPDSLACIMRRLENGVSVNLLRHSL